jgi:farnesyl diphosphate synthase
MAVETNAASLFDSTYQIFLSKNWNAIDSRLHQAIHYCLSGDGKRVRPVLAMMACRVCGADEKLALPAAVAIEILHCYSLAHDDLPCMDDDDMRRGRPSVHKAFDEATALLVGDALLTDSFRVLTDSAFLGVEVALDAKQRLSFVKELTTAAGSCGMVFGQDQDMYWTGKGGYDLRTLEAIHRAKTGALLGAATAMGAIAGDTRPCAVERWREFGILIGLAYQAVDDVLDEKKSTGKSMGKDKRQGKLTFLSLFTNDEVLNLARGYTEQAIRQLDGLGSTDCLIDYVQRLVFRNK